ncbi:hypothetical protein BJX99DRAFT_269373 [Aspergillus californicus]
MPQVIVIGAGFHGLIAAKTYLQVTGAYGRTDKEQSDNDVLIIDSASEIGGTWAQERLYPNLLSQNSYGHYEFSDLPLDTAVPDHPGETDNHQFIPGWKINRYLHIWSDKWDLTRRVRLNWKVVRVSRLPSKQWVLHISQTGRTKTTTTLTCDKLIIATGLTSEPNMPDIPQTGEQPAHAIHSRDVGQYFRENLGYQPTPQPQQNLKSPSQHYTFPRSVAVYGGAKSAFDFIHLFASLHRHSASLGLAAQPLIPVQVHWIIRENGSGPAWMTEPTTQLGRKKVPSDQAVCTRVVGMLGRCLHNSPKRIVWRTSSGIGSWIPVLEGSWARRLLHENPVGRFVVSRVWKSVDASINASANYDSHPKMNKLRPSASAIECISPGGLANHPNLWDTIRGPNVHIYRSSIASISGSPGSSIDLADGTHIPSIDLIVHATGWKLSVPVPFVPPSLGAHLGLPCESISADDYDWGLLEQQAESRMRSIFHSSVFNQPAPATSSAHRLFRRTVAPSLVAEGDRSFAIMGAVYTGNVTAVAEVQALWVAAFLTGGLDQDGGDGPLVNSQRIYESVADDVVWGRLTGAGLSADTLMYNDMLMRDLGLNPFRKGGRWWNELMAIYGPASYAGIVEEWMNRRGGGIKQ